MAPAALAAGPCPCGRPHGRGRPVGFAHCCGRYLGRFEETPAPDAESLMRSRYTAYVLHDEAYLLATWHARTRPARVTPEPGLKWLGLEVRAHRQDGEDRAEVEFVARYRVGGRASRLQECSRFLREAGRWYYLDGDLA